MYHEIWYATTHFYLDDGCNCSTQSINGMIPEPAFRKELTASASPAVFSVMEKLASDMRRIGSDSEQLGNHAIF
jgi:hypothetical protein